VKRANKCLLATALIGLWAGAGVAELVRSEEVAAIDNIPPAPVTNLKALVATDAESKSVALTWILSADDVRSFTVFGSTVVPTGDVRGYRIYRTPQDSAEELIATVGPGVSEYVDEDVEDGVSYIYSVRPFDLDNETDLDLVAGSPEDLARIALVGEPSDVVVVTKIKGKMTLDSNLDLENEEAVDLFKSQFIAQLAALLGISPERITITGLSQGSIVVEFEIADPPAGSTEPTAAQALADLKVEVAAGTDAFDALGGVLALQDESSTVLVPVVEPVDEAGNPILGWFTREGNTVDFDDFFLFADHFGLTTGHPSFDARFDIVPNGAIDFDDFFRFADDFGKAVANADQVRQNQGS
jgi:hypothetical protein